MEKEKASQKYAHQHTAASEDFIVIGHMLKSGAEWSYGVEPWSGVVFGVVFWSGVVFGVEFWSVFESKFGVSFADFGPNNQTQTDRQTDRHMDTHTYTHTYE